MKICSISFVACLLASVWLFGCFTFRSPPPTPPVPPDLASIAKYVDGEPTLRPGVNVRLSVYASGVSVVPEAVYVVAATGDISMPYIGLFKCDGMTLEMIRAKLSEVYEQYFIEPQVTAHFVYQPPMTSPWGTVVVMGQVTRPGPVDIPPTCDLTVTRAIQLAGGVTPIGRRDAVYVTRRKADNTVHRSIVDMEEIGRTGRNDLDITLKAGDVLWVPETVW